MLYLLQIETIQARTSSDETGHPQVQLLFGQKRTEKFELIQTVDLVEPFSTGAKDTFLIQGKRYP